MATSGVSLPPLLEDARIDGLPSVAYYIPNFISEEEEHFILGKIAGAPKPRWKQLTHRRLQTWPSDLVQNRLLDSPLPGWLEKPIVSRILSLPVVSSETRSNSDIDAEPHNIFSESPHERPNHVLINEYPPGVGIMAHKLSISPSEQYDPVKLILPRMGLRIGLSKEDGALDPDPAWRILQEPRSLLITSDKLYTEYLHGIADIEEDLELSADNIVNWSKLRNSQQYADGRNIRQTRTSLTYRDVLKVSKMGNKLSIFSTR
ncbi:hypothetical protein NOR_08469 [Metarhizium rileyi]|uniref:Alkbh6 protein n=1 Tax=Metarhizium rileyi (strain RCEF 4871) TaxID=1649241 RepID=A0A166W8K9_METRR|nr:hypothetical protein NOR_08469 [Metarhizium rileyi RCEF 4871]